MTEGRGILAEQMVWQELLARENRTLSMPAFWVREKKQSNAELDFVVPFSGRLIPMEVKSGKDGTLRSLHQYIKESREHIAVRLYNQKYSVQDTKTPFSETDPEGIPYRLINLPIYCAGKIEDYLQLEL